MTEYDQGLLLALWRLQQAHAASAPPDQPHAVGKARYRAGAQRWEWRMQAEHGPRIAQLYGDGYHDAARKRAVRALARLEGLGLVVLWGEQRNRTHCRLTPEGEKLAPGSHEAKSPGARHPAGSDPLRGHRAKEASLGARAGPRQLPAPAGLPDPEPATDGSLFGRPGTGRGEAAFGALAGQDGQARPFHRTAAYPYTAVKNRNSTVRA